MFVPYNKLSKKQKSIRDREKRTTWAFSPITRTKPSAKVYNRKKVRNYD